MAQVAPMDARIVGDVLVGLIDSGTAPFGIASEDWRPVLAAVGPGHFTMADLVTFTQHPQSLMIEVSPPVMMWQG